MFIITPRQRTTHGLPGAPWEDRKQPATRATSLHGLLLCFSFFWRGLRRPVALVARAFFLCAGGAKAAWTTPPRRVRWRFALASRIGQRPPNVAGGGIRPAAGGQLR